MKMDLTSMFLLQPLTTCTVVLCNAYQDSSLTNHTCTPIMTALQVLYTHKHIVATLYHHHFITTCRCIWLILNQAQLIITAKNAQPVGNLYYAHRQQTQELNEIWILILLMSYSLLFTCVDVGVQG